MNGDWWIYGGIIGGIYCIYCIFFVIPIKDIADFGLPQIAEGGRINFFRHREYGWWRALMVQNLRVRLIKNQSCYMVMLSAWWTKWFRLYTFTDYQSAEVEMRRLVDDAETWLTVQEVQFDIWMSDVISSKKALKKPR